MDDAAKSAASDNAGIRVFPPGVYFAAIALGLVAERYARLRLFAADLLWLRWGGGAAIVAAGAALALAAELMFRRVGTTPIPFRPTTALAFDGPYRFTRNPMYLGLAIAQVGAAVLADSVWVLAFLPVALVAIRKLVIDREEAYLERKFGDRYREYKRRVRRWF